MDTPELSRDLLKAGAEYLGALDTLGLKPEGLTWVYDATQRRFALWLIWAGVDKYGPYQINKLLFRAYNATALPQEIDPFCVFVISPKSSMGKSLKNFDTHIQSAFEFGAGEPPNITTIFHIHRDWIYRLGRKPTAVALFNNWQRFSASVDALAA
ncbi:hypothetical protein [Shinella sp. BYT-45]|uniref:hypothetical protein n=1 Tax=Shinella sp. BYT-45 TaxID=3377377 RepID=UPI00397F8650